MRILSAVHPTTNQKRVIAKVIAAPTPSVAAEEISKNANMVAARNMLMKLGALSLVNGEATLTQAGMQIATDENIADQGGGLTPTGEQLAYDTQDNAQPADDQWTEGVISLKELLR